MVMLRLFLYMLRGSIRLARGWALGCAAGAAGLALAAAHLALPGWLAGLADGNPAGWLETAGLGLLTPLALGACAVELGSRMLTDEQPEGGLELLMAYPLRREWVALAGAAALAIWLLATAALSGLFLWAGFNAGGEVVDAARLAARLGEDALMALGLGGLALAVNIRTGKSRAARTAGLGGLALTALLGLAWPYLPGWLAWVRYLSPLHWSAAGWALPLVGLAALAVTVAAVGMEQREVG